MATTHWPGPQSWASAWAWVGTTLILAFLFSGQAVLQAASPHSHSFPAVANVSGTVSGSDGVPLVGVSIRVKGTTAGALSGEGGAFKVDVPDGATTLIFSYFGYETTEVEIGGRTTLEVILPAAETSLDEVVLVGYGTQKKSDLTGSVASIKGDAIRSVIAGNPTSALQGKMSGIQIENNGGEPGGAANVFVRGVSSLTNSFPLYVIDGTFADNMNFINPKDIERIEVLKDASAAAIYGSRAANGVVLVTTKRGEYNSEPQISVDVRGGVDLPSRQLDFLTGPEFVAYRQQREANDG
ncbi:MAG: TonB-dependent receptor plug domain-containing protein, partial [Bacteroidota bacterium]